MRPVVRVGDLQWRKVWQPAEHRGVLLGDLGAGDAGGELGVAVGAHGQVVAPRAGVVGEEGLAETDRKFLEFGRLFEQQLVHQAAARSLDESMEVGWRILRVLPESELMRLSDAQVARHIAGG